MTIQLTPLPELNRRAFAILTKELGVPDTLRFFNQLGIGQGNYTEERKQLFADLTLDEYRKGVSELRKETTETPRRPRKKTKPRSE